MLSQGETGYVLVADQLDDGRRLGRETIRQSQYLEERREKTRLELVFQGRKQFHWARLLSLAPNLNEL